MLRRFHYYRMTTAAAKEAPLKRATGSVLANHIPQNLVIFLNDFHTGSAGVFVAFLFRVISLSFHGAVIITYYCDSPVRQPLKSFLICLQDPTQRIFDETWL